MKINFKQVSIIILLSVFFSLIRYLLLEENYSLIKKSKLNNVNAEINYDYSDSLLNFIESTESPKLINIDLAKILYDRDLVTFIDARDIDSYNEQHILNSINIPYDLVEEIVSDYDLKHSIDLNEDFVENIFIGNSPVYFSFKNHKVHLSIDEITDKNTNKSSSFLIYCSGEGCSLSEDLGFYLFDQFNIKTIFIYEGGMPEWLNNNYPVQ